MCTVRVWIENANTVLSKILVQGMHDLMQFELKEELFK